MSKESQMKMLLKIISRLCLFSFFLLQSTISFASSPAETSIAPMLQTVLPAVVNIRAQINITDFNTLNEIEKRNRASKSNKPNEPIPKTFVSIASGVIVNAKNGDILTNAHVINDAKTVIVTLSDGRHYTAKILGVDKPSDIALLQIKAPNLTAIPMADSNLLKVGDFVAAIGNPFGLNQSVSSGIISALGRTTLGIENFENFIQTDAPINPGNSGGALINMAGQLIGINTAILAPDRGNIGIGFAIPSNMVKSVMLQLLQYGNVKRGLLGISAQNLTPEMAAAFNLQSAKGAAVTQVYPNSPAEQAGIQTGDIIVAVNNSPIKSASDVVNTIGFLRVNSKININLLRHGKPITATVTLTDQNQRKRAVEKEDPYLYDVALKNFTLLSPIHGNIKGVLVVAVDEGSNAWNSDMRPGDVITSINQERISNIDELKAALQKADKVALLNVLRGQGAIFLLINKDAS
ncbi:MAG: hypothetical protein A3E85_00305 [Gammaproteobacteria bacterium RIFCSPHIGHO2_12_FULL_45_12]|nr:MAG: hypothetical protein A3E85_00305 [Gammaproteobacteria bacterium RIFCSPHIGHO2_12_FULL_45_12]